MEKFFMLLTGETKQSDPLSYSNNDAFTFSCYIVTCPLLNSCQELLNLQQHLREDVTSPWCFAGCFISILASICFESCLIRSLIGLPQYILCRILRFKGLLECNFYRIVRFIGLPQYILCRTISFIGLLCTSFKIK